MLQTLKLSTKLDLTLSIVFNMILYINMKVPWHGKGMSSKPLRAEQ